RMINSIVIVGRLTKDPKIYEREGNKRATFCVAVSRNYKDKNQNIVCDYLCCKAFGKMANNVEKYISQGSLRSTTRQMQSRRVEKEGQMHIVSELSNETIEFMSPRNKKEAEAYFEPPTIETSEPSIREVHLEENDIYEIV